MTKNELVEGIKIKAIWKNKVYIGFIITNPKKAAEKSAKITKGRFISIPIQTNEGKIIQMPYTLKIEYKKL